MVDHVGVRILHGRVHGGVHLDGAVLGQADRLAGRHGIAAEAGHALEVEALARRHQQGAACLRQLCVSRRARAEGRLRRELVFAGEPGHDGLVDEGHVGHRRLALHLDEDRELLDALLRLRLGEAAELRQLVQMQADRAGDQGADDAIHRIAARVLLRDGHLVGKGHLERREHKVVNLLPREGDFAPGLLDLLEAGSEEAEVEEVALGLLRELAHQRRHAWAVAEELLLQVHLRIGEALVDLRLRVDGEDLLAQLEDVVELEEGGGADGAQEAQLPRQQRAVVLEHAEELQHGAVVDLVEAVDDDGHALVGGAARHRELVAHAGLERLRDEVAEEHVQRDLRRVHHALPEELLLLGQPRELRLIRRHLCHGVEATSSVVRPSAPALAGAAFPGCLGYLGGKLLRERAHDAQRIHAVLLVEAAEVRGDGEHGVLHRQLGQRGGLAEARGGHQHAEGHSGVVAEVAKLVQKPGPRAGHRVGGVVADAGRDDVLVLAQARRDAAGGGGVGGQHALQRREAGVDAVQVLREELLVLSPKRSAGAHAVAEALLAGTVVVPLAHVQLQLLQAAEEHVQRRLLHVALARIRAVAALVRHGVAAAVELLELVEHRVQRVCSARDRQHSRMRAGGQRPQLRELRQRTRTRVRMLFADLQVVEVRAQEVQHGHQRDIRGVLGLQNGAVQRIHGWHHTRILAGKERVAISAGNARSQKRSKKAVSQAAMQLQWREVIGSKREDITNQGPPIHANFFVIQLRNEPKDDGRR
eukprot:scaffold895_cov315-Pinguiococcus_pyrenoidosus.AAC.48